VACLYRVSTKGQLTGDDIPMQTKACADFIKKQKTWKMESEYTEKGVSGYHKSADERDALVQIKKDAVIGKFDILLVFMFDRLGRREDETPFIIEWLVGQGIQVWSVKEGQQRFDDHVDKLINYLRYWQSGSESENNSMRITKKHNQLVADGKFRGGIAPYGYTLEYSGEYNKKGHERKKLVIYEPEAMIVRRIFELSCDVDMGSYKVAKILNSEGVLTRTSKSWTVQTIIKILKNNIYKGDYVTGKVRAMRGKKVAAPKESWVHSRELIGSLKIIAPSTWENANANINIRGTRARSSRMKSDTNLRKSRRQPSGKSAALSRFSRCVVDNDFRESYDKNDFLLSNMAYCGYCNTKMYTRTNPIKWQLKQAEEIAIYKSRYYVCPQKSRQGDCSGQFLYGIAKIEAALLEEVYLYLDNIDAMSITRFTMVQVSRLVKDQNQKIMFISKKITSLKNEVVRLEDEITKCLMGDSAFTKKQLSEVMSEKSSIILALESERDAILTETETIKCHMNELMACNKSMVSWKKEFARADPKTQKEIINMIITSVHITSDSINVSFAHSIFH